MTVQTKIASIFISMFLIGTGIIVYQGRPVMDIALADGIDNKEGSETADVMYSLAEIESHNTRSDCWTTINRDVYDLTSWVSRHPGGAQAILPLCGTDGYDVFNTQHGNFAAAQEMLLLLKIGNLE